MTPTTYPSDLTQKQWKRLAPLLPDAKPGGRPREVDLRAVVNAIFYYLKTGCQWRMLPREFPPWSTVAGYYRMWRQDGTWQRIHDALHRQVRTADGRDPCPSAAIIDSQSVKTTEKGGRAATTRGRTSGAASAT
jgi:putative transposase